MEEEIFLKTINAALSNQIKAALATLSYTIDSCRDAEWNVSHKDAPFSGH